MSYKSEYPVALFNGTVATTNGLYSIEDINITEAKKYLNHNGFESAIGHLATAELMADVFNKDIKMNRIQYKQQIGQVAIVFKLKQRPPEGIILNRKEIEDIGFNFKIMKRLK